MGAPTTSIDYGEEEEEEEEGEEEAEEEGEGGEEGEKGEEEEDRIIRSSAVLSYKCYTLRDPPKSSS